MTRDDVIARAKVAIDDGTCAVLTDHIVREAAVEVADAVAPLLAERDELRRRLDETVRLLRSCSEAFHREGWEEGLTSAEVASRVDDYLVDVDTEIKIEKNEARS